jgi:hypothetical protein
MSEEKDEDCGMDEDSFSFDGSHSANRFTTDVFLWEIFVSKIERMYTRKNKTRRGGGLFNFLSGDKAPASTAESNLKAKRNYNLKHSKSRVANILAKPGNFKYTNKERIQEQYQKGIDALRALEKPAESVEALKSVSDKVAQALQSQTSREAGAVVITIPIGVAQLFLKMARVLLAAMIFFFWDIPSFGQMPLSTTVLPNATFNTTQEAYNRARRLTGAR